MTRFKRLYIAHPIAGDGSAKWGDFDKNLERYLHICAYATEQGYAVISWAHHCLTHQAGLTCYRGEDAHDYYLSRDEALLEAADEFWMCAPEGVSRGCDRELRFAASLGIPVYYRVPPGRGPFSGEGHVVAGVGAATSGRRAIASRVAPRSERSGASGARCQPAEGLVARCRPGVTTYPGEVRTPTRGSGRGIPCVSEGRDVLARRPEGQAGGLPGRAC